MLRKNFWRAPKWASCDATATYIFARSFCFIFAIVSQKQRASENACHRPCWMAKIAAIHPFSLRTLSFSKLRESSACHSQPSIFAFSIFVCASAGGTLPSIRNSIPWWSVFPWTTRPTHGGTRQRNEVQTLRKRYVSKGNLFRF